MKFSLLKKSVRFVRTTKYTDNTSLFVTYENLMVTLFISNSDSVDSQMRQLIWVTTKHFFSTFVYAKLCHERNNPDDKCTLCFSVESSKFMPSPKMNSRWAYEPFLVLNTCRSRWRFRDKNDGNWSCSINLIENLKFISQTTMSHHNRSWFSIN